MMAFCPVENMEKLEVNHIDGNKRNNNLDNLEWCTSSENQKHAYKMGLNKLRYGENNNFSKLKVGSFICSSDGSLAPKSHRIYF